MIEKILKKKKISLYRLAKEIGVTYAAAWRWKAGKTTPHLIFRRILEEMLKKIT